MEERTPTGMGPTMGTTTGAPPSGGRLRVVDGTPKTGTPGDALGSLLEDAPAAPAATEGKYPYAGAGEPAGLTVLEGDGSGTGYTDSPEDYEPPEGSEAQDAEAAAASGITAEEEVRRAGVALLDLVLSEEYAWAIYERQCEQGLIGMATRARTLRLALAQRWEVHEQEAVEAALTESAVDTHPESAAAAWELLHAREIVCREYAVNTRDGGVAALLDTLSKEEWLFKAFTHLALDGDGPDEAHLLAVSREAYAALLRRGLRFDPEGFSGHVWRALLEVLPDAPGVRFEDAWADGLLRRAVVYVGQRASPSSYLGVATATLTRAEGELGEALHSRDRLRYRRAVRGWATAVLAASHAASRTPGGGGNGAPENLA